MKLYLIILMLMLCLGCAIFWIFQLGRAYELGKEGEGECQKYCVMTFNENQELMNLYTNWTANEDWIKELTIEIAKQHGIELVHENQASEVKED